MTSMNFIILRTAALAMVLGLCACGKSTSSNPGALTAPPSAGANHSHPPCPAGLDCPSDIEWQKMQAARAKNMAGWGARSNQAAAPDPGSVQFSYGSDKSPPAHAVTTH